MKVFYKLIFKILWIVASILLCFVVIFFRKEISNSIRYKISSFSARWEDYQKLNGFCDSEMKNKSVIIFEPNLYHHECLPGFAKYFVDLGYNVDVLICSGCEDSLKYFEPKNKIRIFTFDSIGNVKSLHKKISDKFLRYDILLSQTSGPMEKELIEKLGFFSTSKSLFVLHDTNFVESLGLKELQSQNRLLGLADYGKLIYVNPNYFGEFPRNSKNLETTFYISSTADREYYYLLESAKRLKNQGYKFKIKVTGRCNQFSEKDVPNYLKDCFEFYGGVSYDQLFSIINSTDFIILNLNPDSTVDKQFNSTRASGSIQLAYGFSKPLIINSRFSNIYKLSYDNSLIYNNEDLYSSMLEAIRMTPVEYSKMSDNMQELKREIHRISLENVKLIVDNI